MADMQIQDANGKQFTVNVSKICDINGDLGEDSNSSVADGRRMKNRVAKVHDVEYVDQNGQAIDVIQLLADMQSGKTNVVALDVQMEATHSGKNHNYCIYYEDSMEKDAESFVNPFKKPMLKNHNDYSGEPLGRITQAWHGPSQLTDERSAIHLKVRVTDQDAIPKFLDGRYGTVSIGGSMGTVTCNICGKTILKDGKFKFCGHWRGESYKDQVCYWGARDIEYREVSTVNSPADDYAQIMKVTVVTDSNKKDNKNNKEEDNKMDGQTANADAVKKSVCDLIDQMLGGNANTNDSNNPSDDKNNDNKTGDTNAQDNKQDNTQDSNSNTEELEKVKKELNDSKAELEQAKKELKETQDSLEKVTKELNDSKEETSQYKEKCITLATANKELVIDGIVAKELGSNKLSEENKDERKKELLSMSMKELNELSKQSDSKDSNASRTPAQVSNPTLANPDKNTDSNNSDSAKNDKKDNNQTPRKTVDDYASNIVGKLFNNR